MVLLVGAVTATTSYIMQQRIREAYLKILEDQFETEVNFFSQQQEARLGTLKGPCEALAKSTAFQAALAKGDNTRLYEVANEQLQDVPLLHTGARPKAPGTEESSLRAGTFVRVLNASGEILRASEARLKPGQQQVRRKLEQQLSEVQKAMDKLGSQQIGLISREMGKGTNLWEMVATPIVDTNRSETLGALVVGVIYFDSAENSMSQMSQKTIQSGILLDEKIHSRTIPTNALETLTKSVVDNIKRSGKPKDTFWMILDGTPQRVFFRQLNPGSPFPPAYQVSIYSMAEAVRMQGELRWHIFELSAAAFAGAMILSFLISHGLSVPLRQLAAATTAVRAGNLQVRVPVRSKDDLGQLAESFNEMTEGLGQKERYRTVLNMVADEKVAKALVEGQLALGGELREISVLFCDIRGFTPYTENMPPEQVIEMLNEHMTALTRVVKEHNGVLDKFVGDLLMAIFGAPVSHETDTLNAARCALALVRERESLNATSRHQLKIGIGIATGRAVAGCMGSFDRLNYTVLGERVNLASRLCSQAGPGQIVIDQATRVKLGDAITATPLPALNLKGFSENVAAFELKEVRISEVEEERKSA